MRSHLLFTSLFSVLFSGVSIFAAVTPEQKREIGQLRSALRRAGVFYKNRKFQQSVEIVSDVQTRFDKLKKELEKQPDKKTGEDLRKLLTGVYKSLHRAHVLLELEGVRLPPLPKFSAGVAGTPGSGISFVKQIAPLLTSKCGRCHIDNARGRFSLATFAALLQGTPAGVVLFAGDAQGSRLIEVIESGDMPRGGGKVSPSELSLLKRWIQEGAKYDGQDPRINLKTLAPANTPSQSAPLTVVQASGKETVSFSNEVAPVFAKSCANCHGNANRPRGRFNLTTFALLLRGGESGLAIAPGKPEESLLIKKLNGTGGGQQMPAGQPPLADAVIGKIETWIREGARFDGPNPNQHVEQVAALAKANSATHEQLSADRAALAMSNWRLGMPSVSAAKVETENFLLLGNAGQSVLAAYGERAEAMAPKVAALLKAPEGRPLIKGRMTLFFFTSRYDYSEFGQMVEKRELPKEWKGHWRYSIVDAYGAMVAPRGDDAALDSLIAQQLASAYTASLGPSIPAWYSDGVGRVAAARLVGGDRRVSLWDQQIPSALAGMSKPDDFLTGKLPPESAAVLGFSFVEFLMRQSRQHNQILTALRSGADFTKAFPTIYGGTPQQLTTVWVRNAAKRRTRRR